MHKKLAACWCRPFVKEMHYSPSVVGSLVFGIALGVCMTTRSQLANRTRRELLVQTTILFFQCFRPLWVSTVQPANN